MSQFNTVLKSMLIVLFSFLFSSGAFAKSAKELCIEAKLREISKDLPLMQNRIRSDRFAGQLAIKFGKECEHASLEGDTKKQKVQTATLPDTYAETIQGLPASI